MTAGSLENTPMSAAGATCASSANRTMPAVAMRAAALNVARTRDGFRAPKFWPATGATAKPSATTGRKPDCMMRSPMPKPAWAEAPNGRMTV